MNFYILTLFPEMVMNGLSTSITGRAIESGKLHIEAINIRDYTKDKHNHVDDYPYGGGAGMVMQAQPVYDAYTALVEKIGRKPWVIYMTPQGRTFNQGIAQELSEKEDIVLLCGHYEGIDERVLEMIVDDYMSIGDFVLTGGELPAMAIVDAVSRLVPGVLNNEDSAEIETFYNNLLEYPQYTRPPEFMDRRVPDVLLSGNHKLINEWRLEQSIERTKANRPDMYEKYIAENPPKEKKHSGRMQQNFRRLRSKNRTASLQKKPSRVCRLGWCMDRSDRQNTLSAI